MSWLQRQAKSREKLTRAVEGYVALRAADGKVELPVVHARLRGGQRVQVFVDLNIISQEVLGEG